MMTQRTDAIFQADLHRIALRTDRMFLWLLVGQWIGGILIALVWSPRTWIAEYWSVHQHVSAATLLGGLFAVYPIYLILRRPGATSTRHIIAIGQMLQSALLVHVTGGRIETHFHVFGSLALLAFYRDWRVLITASAVVYTDHIALGIWFPLSVYGIENASFWRSVEHAFWVGFEVVFLTMAIRTSIQEMHIIADRQVEIEITATELRKSNAELQAMSTALQEANAGLETRVQERTQELKKEINERKLAEARIRQFNAELERRVLDRTVELVAANKELDAFCYSVAHDLRTPLRGINGFAQALLEDYADKLDAEGQDYLNRVCAATRRMSELIDDLLDLSRQTRTEMRREEVNLSHIVQQFAEELQRTHPERDVEFVIANEFVGEGDSRLLRVVLENLLRNAWKFTSKHAHARIEFGRIEHNGRPAFFVKDDGAGFDMAFAGKLFGPFQRLHGANDFPGTGIGLATVQRIIHRHGGKVWAEGIVEKGATFYFTL